MRNFLGTSVRIGIAPDAVTLLLGGMLRARLAPPLHHALAASPLEAPDQLAAALQRLLDDAKCQGARATIVLHDALVRMWLVTPPQNAVRLSDCEAAARLRFQALYGDAPSNWELAADWHPRQPFVACAMPRALLAVLRQLALANRLTLLQVAPQFIGAWNHWRGALAAGDWFGIVHDNILSVGGTSGRRLSALRVAPVPADGHDHAWLTGHLAREALRLGVAAPQRIQLCGAVPPRWLQPAGAALRSCLLGPAAAATVATTVVPALAPALPMGIALAQTGQHR